MSSSSQNQPPYSFFIFDRKGEKIFEKIWKNYKQEPYDTKFLYGFLYSLRDFITAIAPKEFVNSSSIIFFWHQKINFEKNFSRSQYFNYFTTSSYKCHYFQSTTGYKFILFTPKQDQNFRDSLQKLYTDIFVEYVIKNPMHNIGDSITCFQFVEKFEKFAKDNFGAQ